MVSRFVRSYVLGCVVVIGVYLIIRSFLGEKRYGFVAPPTKATWDSCLPLPTDSPYVPADNGHFRWKDVPTVFPVKTLRRLPGKEKPSLPKVQHAFSTSPPADIEQRTYRQNEVKRAFQRCWQAYKDKAWLKDEFAPISEGWKNNFGGWGATLVDNLDTLIIMNMTTEFEEAVDAAFGIDFDPDKAFNEVNIFETTIRHLGGFLSAYDLTKCKDKRLLDKAVEIGEMIYKSFDTPNRMPITRWNPRKAVTGPDQSAADNGIIAELASSSLELTRLSQVTGDMRWFDAIQRITEILDEQQDQTSLPGMWPVSINTRAADLKGGTSYSLGAMADSAFEYLPKMSALLGGGHLMEQYQRLYTQSMDTAIRHILFRPMVPDNADILLPGTVTASSPTQVSLDPSVQHLSCFVGGMLGLGGRLFQNNTHVTKGRKVTEGCVWIYQNSPLRIMPEIVRMFKCESDVDCKWTRRRSEGFQSVQDASYRLRPEAIESVFYLYRITGDEVFQDMGWDMFQAIDQSTRTEAANAALQDVTRNNPPKTDSMESFWTAETLKYFYLLFSEPDLLSLDDFVFNTEAHAFRRNV